MILSTSSPLAGVAQTQGPSPCRQPWLPADAPAICDFTPGPKLPSARTYHASTATPTTLYVGGGYVANASGVQYLNDVAFALIHADGTLGAWRAAPQQFAQARSGLSMATVGKCLFVVGGSWYSGNAAQYGGDVQWAELGGDGVPGAWHTSANHLRTPRSNASLLAYEGPNGTYLYLVAGVAQIGDDIVHLDDVEYTRVNADCTTSAWKTSNYHLHGGRSSPQALLFGDRITVVGGWGDLDVIDVYPDVLLTRIRADGSLEPWRRSATRLPTGLYGHATAVMDAPRNTRLLLAVGGQPGTGAYANWIAYAYAFPSTTLLNAISGWSIAPVGRLPLARAGHTAHLVRGKLYVIGGNTANSQYLDEVLVATVSPGEP